MKTRVDRVAVAVLAMIACALTPHLFASAPDIVTLPLIKVHPGWLAVNYYVGPDGRVVRVLVDEVTRQSPAAQAGLRRGDELIAIDDTVVPGLSGDDFVAAYATNFARHESRVFVFRCYRGFMGKEERIVRFRVIKSLEDESIWGR